MNTIRLTDEQISGFLNQTEAHMSINDICRFGGFSQPTNILPHRVAQSITAMPCIPKSAKFNRARTCFGGFSSSESRFS
jgi:hypothetical protein